MSKKILITGGTGFIGSFLTDKLVRLGHKVASFDADLNFTNNDPYYKYCLKIRKKLLKPADKYFKGDVRDINKLHRAVKNFNPEILIHLAGLPMARVPDNHSNLMLPINMQGTLNVLEVVEKSNIKKLIYTSSSMSYGHFQQTPQTEEFILNPVNAYGATKAAGEYFVKLSKKDWVIIRPTSVYGFTDCANRVTQILIDAAIMNKSAWVVEGETLDFSYIDDVVDGFILCALNKEANGEIFNISRGESRGVTEFADLLKKYFPNFNYEVRKPAQTQVWRGPLSISKAKKILKYSPKYNIEKGIKEILRLSEEHNFYKKLSLKP